MILPIDSTDTSAFFQESTWAMMVGTKDPAARKKAATEATTGNCGISYLNGGSAGTTRDTAVFTPCPVPEHDGINLLGC